MNNISPLETPSIPKPGWHNNFSIFEATPGNNLIIKADPPRFTILAATDTYLLITGKTRKDLIGTGTFEAFPANSANPHDTSELDLRGSFTHVLNEKKPHILPMQRYDVPDASGLFAERHWRITNIPVLDTDGSVLYIVNTAEDLTQQFHSEKRDLKMKEMEEGYRLFMQAPVSIHILRGPDLIIEFANEPTLRLWQKGTEVTGKPLLSILPHLKSQGFPDMLLEVMRSGESKKFFERSLYLPEDSLEENYFNFVVQPYYDNNDKDAVGVLVFANEVTERVRSTMQLAQKNEILKQSEERFQNLVRDATVGIIVLIGKEMKVQIVNQAYACLIGRDVDELVGKNLFDVIPETETYFRPLIEGVLTSGETLNLYDTPYFVWLNGQKKEGYLNLVYQPYRETTGEISGVMVLCQDITESVKVKQALEQSEARFRALIYEAPVATCLFTGREMKIELANDIMLNFWGKSSAVIGMPLAEALPELEGQEFLDILDRVFTTGNAYSERAARAKLMKDGKLETFYFNYTYKPLLNEAGEVYGIIDMAIDVTEQFEAQQQIEKLVTQRTQQLAEANQSLEQNNQELAQFAYIASHDLQEPLRKVSMFAERLKTHLGVVDERSNVFFQKIFAATNRMTQLIRDVLDFSQLTTERNVYQAVDLNNTVKNILSDFELMIEQKEAVVTCGELPVIKANPLQMQQLFGNLISNALKFSKAAETSVIDITARKVSTAEKADHEGLLNTDYYLFKVKDNGIGFHGEYRSKIFSIFQRLHSSNQYAGTGIGLALCKKIVQNHHGDIWAESELGEGATFYIMLPGEQRLPAE